MAQSQWSAEREIAVQAARRGADVLAHWAGRFHVRSKGVNDLVTEADLAVQEAVRETLLRRFPRDAFLGEENPVATDALAARRWIVDPIDGTTNFIHGFPAYCISIALESEGELVVGVILDPARKECFVGARGQGATCNGNALQVSANARLSESLVCMGLPAVPGQFPAAIATLTRFAASARSLRRLGSAALSMAYVAAGRADAFCSHVIQPWDIAAGVVLVREAGGRITNLLRGDYSHRTPDILATNGLVHEETAAQIEV